MPQLKGKGWLNGYKNKTHILFEETHFRPKDPYTLKVSGWKNIFLQVESKRKLE